MRCVRCNRPLTTAAVMIPASRTTYYYGPKCARLAGLSQNNVRVKMVKQETREVDPAQVDWVGA